MLLQCRDTRPDNLGRGGNVCDEIEIIRIFRIKCPDSVETSVRWRISIDLGRDPPPGDRRIADVYVFDVK